MQGTIGQRAKPSKHWRRLRNTTPMPRRLKKCRFGTLFRGALLWNPEAARLPQLFSLIPPLHSGLTFRRMNLRVPNPIFKTAITSWRRRREREFLLLSYEQNGPSCFHPPAAKASGQDIYGKKKKDRRIQPQMSPLTQKNIYARNTPTRCRGTPGC